MILISFFGAFWGGMFGSFAVAGALFRRSRTGRGAHVDLSLLEAMLPEIGAEEIVFDLLVEDCIENEQRSIDFSYSGGPASMLETIVFQDADNDFPAFWIDHFLPLLAQSARNCACPLSVSG